MIDSLLLGKFCDRLFEAAAGEETDLIFDQVARGLGIVSAIFFLFHKLSPAKIETIPNEALVATLLIYEWSDSTTRAITNELVRRKNFFSWYFIFLSGLDPKDLGKRALGEMKKLAQNADELVAVAMCVPPLLAKEPAKKRDKIFEKFCKDFLKGERG